MTSTAVSEKVEDATATLLRETGTPGAAVALKVDDAPVATAGIGHSDLRDPSPMPADGHFPLYSVTKTVLATAALRLVDAGHLSLDEDARNLVPEAGLLTRITLRQLLNHTGGLPDYGVIPEYARDLRDNPEHPWSDAEFIDRTIGRGMVFPPGEGWAYSNIGYLLVRMIVENIGGGGDLELALRQLVFAPSGAKRATVVKTPADMAALVPGFSRQLGKSDEMDDVRSRYHPGWVAHGLVASDAAATVQIMAALFDDDLVSPVTRSEMLQGVESGTQHPLFRSSGYGLGLMIDLEQIDGLVAGHAGGGPGYSIAAFRFEATDGRRVTSVALANRDAGDIGLQIAFAAGCIALGRSD